MFRITNPVQPRTLPVNTGPKAQPTVNRPTNEPHFGMQTLSFGQAAPKIAPMTPMPTPPKTQGTRLDYYA